MRGRCFAVLDGATALDAKRSAQWHEREPGVDMLLCRSVERSQSALWAKAGESDPRGMKIERRTPAAVTAGSSTAETWEDTDWITTSAPKEPHCSGPFDASVKSSRSARGHGLSNSCRSRGCVAPVVPAETGRHAKATTMPVMKIASSR